MSEVLQGTPEWRALRLGHVTASRVADVVARTKTGWGASRANYAAELVAERLTGEPADSFVTAAMARGIEAEPDARAAYEFRADLPVVEVGYVLYPRIGLAGASPDGLVGDDGLVEIKCPNTATHIETLLSDKVPARYVTQMIWQMACTDRAWCDFVSYDPRLPASMQLYVHRVHRDDAQIAALEEDVSLFLAEVAETVSRLRSVYNRPLTPSERAVVERSPMFAG